MAAIRTIRKRRGAEFYALSCFGQDVDLFDIQKATMACCGTTKGYYAFSSFGDVDDVFPTYREARRVMLQHARSLRCVASRRQGG